MLQGCGFETSMLGAVIVSEINKKIDMFSKKMGTIDKMKPLEVLPYLKAAAEMYPLAVKLREMAETDAVYGAEKMLKDVNSILKKLVEETGGPEDEFGGWEIPSHNPIPELLERPEASEDWMEGI